MIRSMHTIGCVVGLALAFSAFIPAQAQGKKAAEYIPGTVASIEKDKTGKNYKMKITKTDDGEELDVTITIRTPVFVSAAGDEGFLKAGVVIETQAMMSQNNLFADSFTVYVGPLSPSAKVTPDKEKPKELFDIVGKVVETAVDGVVVQMVGGGPQKIGFEKGKAKVNVKISDASLIKEGDEVTVEGTLLKSKKPPTLNATMINVTQKEPIKSEEYMTALEERKGKPKTTAKTKTTTKTKTEGGDAPMIKDDPFNVLPGKKKTAKEKADEKKEEAAAKKDDAKKTDAKEEAKKDDAKEGDAKKDEVKKDDAKKTDEKKAGDKK